MTVNNHVGQIVTGVMAEMPNGWIPMLGQQILQSLYPQLTAIAPSAWLIGANIHIPNMTRRATIGKGGGVGIPVVHNTLGATGGVAEHTLTIAEMPSHNHAPSVGTQFLVSTPSTTGIVTNPAFPVGGGQTANRGGGLPHNNMPPFLVINYFIFGGV